MDVDNPSGHNSFIDLPKELFQMLACTGPFLYRDTMLLQKVHQVVLIFLVACLLCIFYADHDFPSCLILPQTCVGLQGVERLLPFCS